MASEDEVESFCAEVVVEEVGDDDVDAWDAVFCCENGDFWFGVKADDGVEIGFEEVVGVGEASAADFDGGASRVDGGDGGADEGGGGVVCVGTDEVGPGEVGRGRGVGGGHEGLLDEAFVSEGYSGGGF